MDAFAPAMPALVLLLPYRGSRIPIYQEDAEVLFPASVIQAARRR